MRSLFRGELTTSQVNTNGFFHKQEQSIANAGALAATQPTLPLHIAASIFRLLQEIIHNTVKHANATELIIRVNLNKKYLLIYTCDNGQEFDCDQAINESTGLGLKSIEGRVDLLKGTTAVRSNIDQGTAYNIEIPFTAL